MPGSGIAELDVLVVDDDEGDVLMITEALESSRHRHIIQIAPDGEQAVALLRRLSDNGSRLPDVILLDLNMPRMNGHQVLQVIKNDDRFRRIPVVVLTTSNAPTDIVGSYDRHANAYVTKPMTMEEFIAVVGEIDNFFGSIVELPRDTP
ncbi:response regulator [Spongisporangium articulatum]|uniref:Response regulator n=1 Tax=Spongisporangium articulatum TaxID=3362603 RepID=A0ABW8AJ77_9ACTN